MRAATAQIVSANDLMQGDVIYLAAAGGWTRCLAEAALAADAAGAARLLTLAEADTHRAVGPYLVAVSLDGPAPRPLHLREVLRTRGPSIRPDLGRQAEER